MVHSKEDLLAVKRSLQMFKCKVQSSDSQQQSVSVRKCQALMVKTGKLDKKTEIRNDPHDFICNILVSCAL